MCPGVCMSMSPKQNKMILRVQEFLVFSGHYSHLKYDVEELKESRKSRISGEIMMPLSFNILFWFLHMFMNNFYQAVVTQWLESSNPGTAKLSLLIPLPSSAKWVDAVIICISIVLKVRMILRRERICSQKGSEKKNPKGEAHCRRMKKRNSRTEEDLRQNFCLFVFLVNKTVRSIKPAYLTEYLHIVPKLGNYD